MEPSKPASPKPPNFASASVPDTLAALHVNPDTGLTQAEVGVSRKEHGYNEVAETKGHPVLKFLGKFWGISAWMLELIMVLSAVLRKFSDLAVVGALLVVNAVLSFMQEHRAAGVVEAMRKRLQVSARVRRESTWQVIPARELVPRDIVRVRPGDIVPADVKLLTGASEERQEAILRSLAAAYRTPSVLRRGKKSRRAAFPKQGRSSPTPGQLHQETVEADLEEAWTRWSSTCVPARKRKFARSPARTDEGATRSVGSRRPTNNHGLHARDWGRPQKGGRATWRILCPSSP